jgi:Resolvase, N terminal domain
MLVVHPLPVPGSATQLACSHTPSADPGTFAAPLCSGKLPLSKGPGLLAAIETIEAGGADQLVVAYFDRLVRSLKVQLEVIERVEGAGGEIIALDHGKLTSGRRRSACRPTCSGRCSNALLRSREGRPWRLRRGRWRGVSIRTRRSRSGMRARRGRRAGGGARGREDGGAGVQAS